MLFNQVAEEGVFSAIAASFNRMSRGTEVNGLNEKQRQVVECIYSNCLVVACPGSGKTHVLIRKAAQILKKHPNDRILIVTFTADSANEVKSRIISTLGPIGLGEKAKRQVDTGTFHSVGLRQLQNDKNTPKKTILSPGQMQGYVLRAISEAGLSIDLEEALQLIDEAKSDPTYDGGTDAKGKLFATYAQLTERNQVIDFADMLSLSVRGMRAGLILPLTYEHIFIDEAQDMDELQYAWCAEHIKTTPERRGSICTVVGDDDQCIYGFRKALGYEGMMRFKTNFGASIIKLETNYRSNQEILKSAEALVLKNETRIPKSIYSHRGKGGHVEAWHCGSLELEADMLALRINELCQNFPVPAALRFKAKVVDRVTKQESLEERIYNYTVGVGNTVLDPITGKATVEKNWAVLTRNNYQLNIIASVLRAEGIPYSSNVKTIWDDIPVCYVLSLLRSIVTNERVGFDDALHFAGIENETLIKLHNEFPDQKDGRHPKGFSAMFDRGVRFDKYGGPGAERILSNFAEEMREWKRKSADHLLNMVLKGVFGWFIAHHLKHGQSDKEKSSSAREIYRLETAERLLSKQLLDNRYDSLVTIVNQVRSPPTPAANTPTVYIGTLHSSKGLEFENVWLAGVDVGVIPAQKPVQNQGQGRKVNDVVHIENDEEEERRLFYVGMTRAMTKLFISSGEKISRFVDEANITPIRSPNFGQKSSMEKRKEEAEQFQRDITIQINEIRESLIPTTPRTKKSSGKSPAKPRNKKPPVTIEY